MRNKKELRLYTKKPHKQEIQREKDLKSANIIIGRSKLLLEGVFIKLQTIVFLMTR